MATASRQLLLLDGNNLTPEDLLRLSRGEVSVDLSPESWASVDRSRGVVTRILEGTDAVYGINTGFGNFAHVRIAPDQLQLLQQNLIRSHAAGVGAPLSPERTRMLMALRINVLAKGYSGISVETLKRLVAAFNADCLPMVPEKGTVGASGDLAPLAHLAMGLMGEGDMWDEQARAFVNAGDYLARKKVQPLHLQAKEGLALINGTQFITALGVEALVRAERVAATADLIAAMSHEALRGHRAAYAEGIHRSRPHTGQQQVAARLRALLNLPSEMATLPRCSAVQDSYTLRCVPQVHGICHDTLAFVRGLLTTEMNSATDNPMVLVDPADPLKSEILSGGNFHGEYPAKALDYLCIALQELANISERRTDRLVNTQLSGLPPFLVREGGLNSGFMIAHCTAAALTAESRTLCLPASCDTIPTSAAKEDHVSMGGWSARKALQVVGNLEVVIAIELLCATQAFDLLRPATSTAPLERVYSLVRRHAATWDKDRYMKPDIDACTRLVASGAVLAAAGELPAVSTALWGSV
jgi:histidine ammonia-lyase